MSELSETELKLRFSGSGSDLEADVLAELRSIMRLHSIDVDELWFKWESYIMKMGSNDMKLDIDSVRNLKKNIQDDLETENRSKIHHSQFKQNTRTAIKKNEVFNILDSFVPTLPKGQRTSAKKLEISSLPRAKVDLTNSLFDLNTPSKLGENNQLIKDTPSFERINPGITIETLNEHLPKPNKPKDLFSESRIKLTANSDIKKLSYKPMAMKCSEASEILDDKIDEHMFMIQDHYKLDDSDFGSAASQSINEIIAVGRIGTDALDGKLNSFSLVLETSRRMGGGLRVPLRVESLQTFQFFPGQIVAIKGINSSGDSFTVSEIIEPPLLPGAASSLANLRCHRERLRGGTENMDPDSDPVALNIIVSAGPYTTDDNLNFEPLKTLFSEASNSYADGLIMTGPFLDIDHPLIADGDFDIPSEALIDSEFPTMTTLFRHFISPFFNQLVTSNPNITIILVPSVRDAISKHVSWPQEPFPRKDLGLPKSVKIIGNPMIMSLNEISIGISSQDILTELRISEVISKTPKDVSLLARLPKYLIQQRNFFPLFPSVDRERLPKTGTSNGVPTGAMLDTSYLKLGEIINVRPDILVVPSALPPFAKVVESVIVINPGYLSKRKAAGSYARISVLPAILNPEEQDSSIMAHKVYQRARVDIFKI